MAPYLADQSGALGFGEHEDVEQLGAWGPARARPGARVAGARARRGAGPEGYLSLSRGRRPVDAVLHFASRPLSQFPTQRRAT
jgi:hypothetical protein